MPFHLAGTVAVLEGHCSIEEAETLAEALRGLAQPQVDRAGCAHLHLAVLQTLLALRPALAAPPADPLLRRLTAGLPAPDGPAG